MRTQRQLCRAGLVLSSVIILTGCGDATDIDAPELELSPESYPGAVVVGTYVDSFDEGKNTGNWYLGNDMTNPATGGNPDFYLENTAYLPAPLCQTDGDSLFTGDYFGKRVEGLGVDLVLFSWPVPPGDLATRRVHLVLSNLGGTPSDPTDDMGVWIDTGDTVPSADGAWREYFVDIPLKSEGLPPGAVAYEAGYTYESGADADRIWQAVISDVDRVGWSWGYPLSAAIYSWKHWGMDNALIEYTPVKKSSSGMTH